MEKTLKHVLHVLDSFFIMYGAIEKITVELKRFNDLREKMSALKPVKGPQRTRTQEIPPIRKRINLLSRTLKPGI
ncbi:MAG: hypothetical protein JRI22_14775 [Deltaproteobacteria bacterium]|nr:hypothetical protein [Deltaproteobacteria bacterium]